MGLPSSNSMGEVQKSLTESLVPGLQTFVEDHVGRLKVQTLGQSDSTQKARSGSQGLQVMRWGPGGYLCFNKSVSVWLLPGRSMVARFAFPYLFWFA